MIQRSFTETLENPVPFEAAAVNPFRFTKLFDGTPRKLKMILFAIVLMCFPEGKNLSAAWLRARC